MIWGWATWKRAWDLYDVDMKKWKEESVKLELKERYSNREFKFLSNRFDSFFKNYSDTWDIQWYFNCIYNKGLSIIPEANLVSNIGVQYSFKKIIKLYFSNMEDSNG